MSAWRLRITRFTDEEFAKLSYGDKRTLRSGLWHPPTYVGFEAPAPKPPDYSTPAAVTARCYEGGGWTGPETGQTRVGQWWTSTDRSFPRLYRAFCATQPYLLDMRPYVADWHRPKWEYRMFDGHYERRALQARGAQWEKCE